jgi:REP element-mobilizing transposase RayT
MARPLRIEMADGWYHVTARGNERRAIFRDDRDRTHFVELVGELTERFGVRVHAYVLMDNHHHLLVSTPRGGLSAAMQWLGVSYSVWFNRRHGRVGHLFQGRFKAVVLEGGAAVVEVSRYVHLNPVRLERLGLDKGMQRAARAGRKTTEDRRLIERRLAVLREYRWSSYRAYAGWARGPAWLDAEAVLAQWPEGGQRKPAAYREHVEHAVREGLPASPWERLEAGMVLGGREFVDRVRAKLRGNRREQTALRRLEGRAGFGDAVAAVEKVKGEKWESFRDRHGDWGRDMVMYLARRRCGMKLAELGAALGGLDYATVSAAVKRFGERLDENKALAAVAKQAEAEMLNPKM